MIIYGSSILIKVASFYNLVLEISFKILSAIENGCSWQLALKIKKQRLNNENEYKCATKDENKPKIKIRVDIDTFKPDDSEQISMPCHGIVVLNLNYMPKKK